MNWDELAARIGCEFLGPKAMACKRHQPAGFSGAVLWRLKSQGREYALRAWPEPVTPRRLQEIHDSLRLAASINLPVAVPLVHQSGETWTAAGGRLWEVAPWLPGEADLSGRWSSDRLRVAQGVLADLHKVWKSQRSEDVGICSAAVDRLKKLLDMPMKVEVAARRLPHVSEPRIRELLSLAIQRLDQETDRCVTLLRPWADRPVPRQMVLADAWAEHFLFCGGQVMGLVDFGGLRWDAIEVALARLIHSAVGLRVDCWSEESVADLAEGAIEGGLLRALLATASVAGLEAWLRWLLIDRREVNPVRAAERLQRLLQSP